MYVCKLCEQVKTRKQTRAWAIIIIIIIIIIIYGSSSAIIRTNIITTINQWYRLGHLTDENSCSCSSLLIINHVQVYTYAHTHAHPHTYNRLDNSIYLRHH